MYYFYVLRASDDSLYCGVTTNLQRRLKEHNFDVKKGSKYLRSKKPVILVYYEEQPNINSALKREIEVKKWPKAKKEELVRKNV